MKYRKSDEEEKVKKSVGMVMEGHIEPMPSMMKLTKKVFKTVTDCKVGETYEFIVKAKCTAIEQDKYFNDGMPVGRFEITKAEPEKEEEYG